MYVQRARRRVTAAARSTTGYPAPVHMCVHLPQQCIHCIHGCTGSCRHVHLPLASDVQHQDRVAGRRQTLGIAAHAGLWPLRCQPQALSLQRDHRTDTDDDTVETSQSSTTMKIQSKPWMPTRPVAAIAQDSDKHCTEVETC